MINEKFDELCESFMYDKEVVAALHVLKEKFETLFKEIIESELDEEEISDSIGSIYEDLRECNPDEYTIFDVFLLNPPLK